MKEENNANSKKQSETKNVKTTEGGKCCGNQKTSASSKQSQSAKNCK